MENNHGLHLIEDSSGTRHCRRCLTSVNPFNSHSNPAAGIIGIFIVQIRAKRQRMGNLSEVTQPVSGGAGI